MKYNVMQISKTLDKIFNAGFNTERLILTMQMEDLQKVPDLTSVEMNIIIDLKKAIRTKQLIAFLSGTKEEKKIERKI